MLMLREIELFQFKNYPSRSFTFPEQVIALAGNNGIGKTNLLDAIFYLCFTRSYFSNSDSQNVHQGTEGFRIEGHFQVQDKTDIVRVLLREHGKKEVSCNDLPYERMAHHLGKFPAVMIAPDDVDLINGGSENRRKLLDALLCQLDSGYLSALSSYNKVLQQRNTYLRQTAEGKMRNDVLLDTLDDQLIHFGTTIHKKRSLFFPAFRNKVIALYTQFAGIPEQPDLFYESPLNDELFETLLRNSREKDHMLQRSSTGIHKDNILITLGTVPFKLQASQGQRKSMLFALKLAEAECLKENKGFAPLLLLDDVFEKLDARRMKELLNYVVRQLQPQLFLTDTHPERIQETFRELDVSYDLCII
jgi:DNA replication and repair protein RecF